MFKLEKQSKVEEERAIQIHEKAIVVDMCNPGSLSASLFDDMLQGGITASCVTVALLTDKFKQAMKSISNWYSIIEQNSEVLLLVTSVDDFKRAKKEGKAGVVFTFHDATPIEGDLTLIKVFQRVGVRVMALTYNARSLYGDGCAERTKSGLSDLGIKAVEEMNKTGIVLDLAHVCKATAMDAIEFSKSPCIISHANAKSVCDMIRNKDDEEISALAEKGGVIGVRNGANFISKKREKTTIEDMVDHIDYIVKLVGIDHVGIGLDLSGIRRTKEQENETMKLFLPELGFFPGSSRIPLDTVAKLPSITKVLVARGYSNQEIEKILGDNVLRVFDKVWESR